MAKRHAWKNEYSVTEVANMMDVNRQTVLRMIHRGAIRTYRRGKVFRITLAALKELSDIWESILLKRNTG